MIDLHTHILPAIDDGATNLEESIVMCRAALQDGCRTLVATPHHRHPSFPEVDLEAAGTELARLQRAVGPSLHLQLGAEVRVDDELVEEVLAAQHELATLGNSRAILLEFPDEQSRHDPVALVHELVVAGLRPVLAHPELIPWLLDDIELLRSLVRRGALLQVTAASVTGDFGGRLRNRTRDLIDSGLVHVVASDCHDTRYRVPGLSNAWQVLNKRWGCKLADALTQDNPQAILSNEPLRVAA